MNDRKDAVSAAPWLQGTVFVAHARHVYGSAGSDHARWPACALQRRPTVLPGIAPLTSLPFQMVFHQARPHWSQRLISYQAGVPQAEKKRVIASLRSHHRILPGPGATRSARLPPPLAARAVFPIPMRANKNHLKRNSQPMQSFSYLLLPLQIGFVPIGHKLANATPFDDRAASATTQHFRRIHLIAYVDHSRT